MSTLAQASHESEVLASCIIAPEQIDVAIDAGLTADAFRLRDHKRLWMGLVQTAREGALDIVSLREWLKSDGVESPVKLIADHMDRVGSVTEVPHHVAAMLDRWRKDAARVAADTFATDIAKPGADFAALHAALTRRLDELAPKPELTTWTQRVARTMSAIEDGTNLEHAVSTGVSAIDDLVCGGLQPGWLSLVLAGPGVGKTAFAIGNVLSASSRAGQRAAVASLEMSDGEVVQRLLAGESGVPVHGMRPESRPDWPALNRAADAIAEWDVAWLDGCTSVTAICASLRAESRRRRVSLLVVDYLQLVSNGLQNRVEDLELTAMALKSLARDEQCHVMLLSQPTLDGQRNRGSSLALGDAKGAQGIGAAVDVCFALGRPGMGQDNGDMTLARVDLVKFRHGPIGRLGPGSVRFDGDRMRFRPLTLQEAAAWSQRGGQS